MDIFGSGSGPPSGERIRWETGTKPIGEGLWGGEVVVVLVVNGGCFCFCGGQRHDWEVEESRSRVETGGGFGRLREDEEGESGKDEIGKWVLMGFGDE